MKRTIKTFGMILPLLILHAFSKDEGKGGESVYQVVRLKGPMKIDGNWDKPQWQKTSAIDLKNYMGAMPKFKPAVQAKMMYDDANVYVIFRAEDRYVRCIANQINGRVWEDSCVEFFFSPDTKLPERYFNLETNCGGTALMHYHVNPKKENPDLEVEDIKKIEIAHSMPQQVDPEITEPTTWTLEYRIPLAVLEKVSAVTRPGHGVIWRANFYKCADKSSNPHWITWSPVENDKPNFHLPRYFGVLEFE
jgi:hypothetical protein